MTHISEILFVDPAVADIETIVGNLRPGVEAVLLDSKRPAARQIAITLADRSGLDAVHVIAHGTSGRVVFAAGEWSVQTVASEADDLAAIGRSLAAEGKLRVWSCDTARGEGGEAFVEALRTAANAEICAATTRIGAATLGGTWQLQSDRCTGAAIDHGWGGALQCRA